MNRLSAGLVAVVVGASLVTGVNRGAATEGTDLKSLESGHSVAWPGEYVDTVEGGSFESKYTLLTTDDDGKRLRVALDVLQDYKADGTPHETADLRRDFKLEVIDAAGRGQQSGQVGAGYSTEVFVCFHGDPCVTSFFHPVDCAGEAAGAVCDVAAPPANCDDERCSRRYGLALPGGSEGEWTIRVSGDAIDGWTFRMRAMLESQPKEEDPGDEPLFPNLRARPPFELTLDCTPTMGYGAFVRSGTCGTAALGAISGVPPGCSAQEIAESQEIPESPAVEWCLRFSGGNENAGDGGLEIVASNPKLSEAEGDEGKVYATAVQVIRSGDGAVERFNEDAGRLVFEDSHGHWHYDGFMRYELFSAGKKEVLASNEGLKRGWCPVDEFIADWDSFNQVPRGSGPVTDTGACLLATPNAVFGQSAGWGDIYEWAREEQFVPFEVHEATGKPQPGEYVLRETIDSGGHLWESDEDDNTAYAYFEVLEDGLIQILERGYGSDPWDPHRQEI